MVENPQGGCLIGCHLPTSRRGAANNPKIRGPSHCGQSLLPASRRRQGGGGQHGTGIHLASHRGGILCICPYSPEGLDGTGGAPAGDPRSFHSVRFLEQAPAPV